MSAIKQWNLKEKFGEITKTIFRFPVTFLFLLAVAVLNAISIENQKDFEKPILALVFGVFCFTAAQMLFECFGKKASQRLVFLLGATALTVGYYLPLYLTPSVNTEIVIRTVVSVFALLVAFVWIPSIKKVDFNDIFLILFKSMFTSAFFSAIIWGGVSLIVAAVDQLLFKVGSNTFIHIANVIWVLWAPVFVLSMIPMFTENDIDEESFQKASNYPRFLEVLISYVLIPLTAVYTLVLLLFIVKTILLRNWNDNLLEPMILSYCIAVLLLYLLSSGLQNRFAIGFRFIFPKLLVPVALFQVFSSSIMFYQDGMTHTRYFVLLFGVYSVISGILLSILPLKRNGVIASLAIFFALISIIPPVDAFSVSRTSQMTRLENTLRNNNMIEGNHIVYNASISEKDKKTITRSVRYFNDIGELKHIVFLPKTFDLYLDFKKTFGFELYEGSPYNDMMSKFFSVDPQQPFLVGNYEYLSTAYFDIPGNIQENTLGSITQAGKDYTLILHINSSDANIQILDSHKEDILLASLKPMLDDIAKQETVNPKGLLPADKMMFDIENEHAKMRIFFQNASVNYGTSGTTYNASVYILFSIK